MASSHHPLKRSGTLAGLTVTLVSVVAASRPFWPGQLTQHPWMTFVRDDFFYYLRIATHLAAGHGSTFNGIVPTNGYHPLWMLLVTLLCRFSSAPASILGFVAATTVLSTIAMYVLSRGVLECCDIRGWLGSLTAAYVALCALPLCFYGMEVTLAMPLAMALSWHVLRWTHTSRAQWWLVAGILTSLLTLARVDAILLAILLAGALFSTADACRSLRWSHLAALIVGCLPLIAYLLWNRISFGLWLPVSGVAKQLRHGWAPAFSIWASVIDGPSSAWINLLLIVIALVFVLVRWKMPLRLHAAVLFALLAYPVLFVLLLSMRSDWEMWPWYAWIWRPATCAALAVMLGALFQPLRHRQLATVAVALLLAMRIARSTWYPGQYDYYQAAVDVQAFANTHPGIYAMGDRAGMISWLLPAPLMQAEGLVMDRGFLHHIERQDPLLPVLRSYGVRYYMADDWAGESLMHNGCFAAVEPAEAGAESPHMRSRICQPPVFSTTHNEVTTLVYDLSKIGDGER